MPAAEPGDITHWIHELKCGQEGEAQQRLWNAYFARLVRVARNKLAGSNRVVADEEDVVVDAFNSFFVRVKQGSFPDLNDRTNLWPLLVTITARKASNQRRREKAQKRRPQHGAVVGGQSNEWDLIAQIVGREPSPEFAAQSIDEAEHLLGMLDDSALRTTSALKLQGYTNREIAERLGVIERTIERRLACVRTIWEGSLSE